MPSHQTRIDHLQRMTAEHLQHTTIESFAWDRPDNEALIAHTLALFDSALEKPHAKSKH